MATIDIGKLTFTHKGDYAGGTAYVANDVVYYNGSAYIAKTSTTGNLPTSTAHWNTFAAGSGGIWNGGLSLGSAGQVVKVNSGASALEFGDVSGTFKQMQYTVTATRATYSYSTSNNNSSSQVDTKITPLAVTITPESSSSKILISCSVAGETSDSPWDYTFGFTRTVGGTDYMLAHNNGVANQTGNRGKMGITAIPTSYAHTSSNNDSTPEAIQYSFVDAPNTTSAITYTATFNNDNGGNWQLNATQNNTAGSERFVSTIYVMEF